MNHSNDLSSADRREKARRLVAEFVRQRDGSAHEALLESHPGLREELELELQKLRLVHGALQRAAVDKGAGTDADGKESASEVTFVEDLA